MVLSKVLSKKIYVAGHRGLVGSALMRALTSQGCTNIITRTHAELDLTNQAAVQKFFAEEKPEYVILAAAKVGGIHANDTYPAEFIHLNLAIQTNVIHESWRAGVQRLLFLGSSCIYPRDCLQPIKEEYLLTGPLERTNRSYALAKISGVEMCWAYNRQYGTRYLAAMPTNLYGPGDNYNLENSHVLPALIRKMHLAKLAMSGDSQGIKQDEVRYGEIPGNIRHDLFRSSSSDGTETAKTVSVKIWGTGTPRREFLHSEDMAAACVHLMRMQDDQFDSAFVRETEPPLVNIGCGQDVTIREVAEIVKDVVGFKGECVFDTTKPDGTPRKLLDVSRLFQLGWRPRISFRDGITSVYKQYS